jgi:transaldolase/glucose-6-phosphate isomerase
MATSPLIEMQKLGQSPWHDNIRRGLLVSGALRKLVKAGDITGLTSNPTIFEQAIAQSADYDAAIEALARQGKSAEEIFDALSIEDIRAAAEVFTPVFKRTRGGDGYVSIEVSPKFAHDSWETIKEARRLWKAVNCPNLMVKIPATPQGIPAIEQCIADGLNINVTLIFSLKRYDEVMEAYLRGLERRAASRKPLAGIASVASFFVSRVDTLVDKLLDEKIKTLGGDKAQMLESLKGKAAIANAKLAYADFRRKFGSDRFAKLRRQGARLQRPLWASTSTKNPAYRDVYYIEALVGPDTVDTMPPATIAAYKDHGKPEIQVDKDPEHATKIVEQLEEFGVKMDAVTQKLEDDGVASFARSFDTLLAVVEMRRRAVLAGDRQRMNLGRYQKAVAAALAGMDQAKFVERLWKKDSTLWKPDDPAHQAEIKMRLGWLEVVDLMQTKVGELQMFVDDVRLAGFKRALLCGMGGSSLAPEVLRETFGAAQGYLDLRVLDSTDPAAVLAAEEWSDPAHTLYLIASKSGSTTEPNAFFAYFWEKVKAAKGGQAGGNFIAITDPGTAMERKARAHNFRRIFANPPDIGGRYSALSFFGLVPAALMGIDVEKLLARAKAMSVVCSANIPAARNVGLALGAALGALARTGRDKLTLVADPHLAAFGGWVEQLIAESTGKEGRGIVPLAGEPLGRPDAYGKDRVFVHLPFHPKSSKSVPSVDKLARAGHPVIEIDLRDKYDIAAEFLRWEIATAAAGYVLGIDPFDQPNVQESKDNTVRLLQESFDSGGALAPDGRDFAARLRAHLQSARAGDYVALCAYVARTPRRERALRALRAAIRQQYKTATTVGFGPRFLHSTGQLHKGGANNGVFIQFVCDDSADVPVPGEAYTFGVLKAAQALGDFQSLESHQRRALRVNLGANVDKGLEQVLAAATAKPKRKVKKTKSRATRKRK